MNIYILPFSEDELDDNLFNDRNIAEISAFLWRMLQKEGAKKNLFFHTIDRFEPLNAAADDVLLVLNHPEESFWWRLYYLWKYWGARGGFVWKKRELFYKYSKFFSRRILLQLEPPVAAPTVYRRLAYLKTIYDDIYLICRGFGDEFKSTHFIYDSYNRDEAIKKYFNIPKQKFLVMVNANSAPHTFYRELYGERIKAIKFFSRFSDFDLYGPRWNFCPKHIFHWFSGRFIRRAWRGSTKNKLETISHYKFGLAFENCSYPGYVSEKIFDFLVAGVVPVYLGAPDIEKYIPRECFIDARKFRTYRELESFLRKMTDREREAYRLAARNFFNDNKDAPFTARYFVDFLITCLTSRAQSSNAVGSKLHLGCGELYLEGYVNIDFPPEHHTVVKVKADLYSDIRNLKYPENSIEEIRLHHVFEHFSRQEALKLLADWRKWLKPGGKLVIETPDVETAFQMFAETDDLKKRFALLRHVFGSHEADWAYHKDGWGEQKFKFILEKFGFEDIECEKVIAYHSNLRPKKFGGVIGRLLPEKIKDATGDRLPNIVVRARKGDKEIDTQKVIREILSLSIVGVEDELFETWLKDIGL